MISVLILKLSGSILFLDFDGSFSIRSVLPLLIRLLFVELMKDVGNIVVNRRYTSNSVVHRTLCFICENMVISGVIGTIFGILPHLRGRSFVVESRSTAWICVIFLFHLDNLIIQLSIFSLPMTEDASCKNEQKNKSSSYREKNLCRSRHIAQKSSVGFIYDHVIGRQMLNRRIYTAYWLAILSCTSNEIWQPRHCLQNFLVLNSTL